jgi:pyruvate dehydrogenase E2 component (dihydrolipoamide acetyltransferase)
VYFFSQADSAENLGKYSSYHWNGASAPAAAASLPSSKAAPRPPAPAPRSGSAAKGKSGPAVKKLLAESGLNASQINGTGPRGMVVKGDVLAAMKGGMKPQAGGPVKSAGDKKGEKSIPDTPLRFKDIPNTPIRKVRHCHCSYNGCLTTGPRLSWSYTLRTVFDFVMVLSIR